ncbi:hypothetical protein M8J77_022970 [Diaphorina citri]|nr:hypothetical protein M8J77_022970 [Diaphorina citri]
MAKKSDTVSRKKCRDCKKNIPLAFKGCPDCNKTSSSLRNTRGTQRRTQRTTRERPKFFDSSAFQKKRKKQVNRKPVSSEVKEKPVKAKAMEKSTTSQPSSSQPPTPKAKKAKKTREPKDTEEESSNIILAEKAKQCSIILLQSRLTNHTTLSHLVSSPLYNQVLEFFGKFQNSIDGTDSWFQTSARSYPSYEQFEGCPTTIWKKGGYNNALKLLMKQMPDQTPIDLTEKILLKREIEKINWEDSNAVVVTCADGSQYSAEKVLITVSLGVLKSKSDLFVPPLPPKKTNAIEGLFIGTVDKIFLKFAEKWWPDGNLGFNFFWTKEDENTLFREIGGVNGKPWLVDAFGFYLTTEDPLTFLGWVTGPSARYMETLTDEQVQIDVMKLFRHFLGSNYTIPEPVRCLKSNWGTHNYFKGSYSSRSLITEKLNTSAGDLAAPVTNEKGKPVLLFAGEATSDHHYSTVHGAIETGWREADRLLKSESHSRYSSCIAKDVVIVGAGMAGIGAALTFLQNGVTNFVLLEAQSQAGGRIKSVDIGAGVFLEEGAQWIHGQNNPVYQTADQYHLTSPIRSDEAQGHYLRDDGTEVPLHLVHQVAGAVGDMLEQCEEFWKSQTKDYPASIGDYLDEQFDVYVKSQLPDQDVISMKQLFDWHRRFQIIDNSCTSLYNLSAKAWGQYEFCGGDDYINLTQGFSSVIDTMVKQIPSHLIRYQCPVEQILWRDSNDQVNDLCNGDTIDGNSIEKDTFTNGIGEEVEEIIVKCEDGTIYRTKHVVVTASLGYLKENQNRLFVPRLPQHWSQAISSMGFSSITKIFLVYDRPWWSAQDEGFQFIWSGPDPSFDPWLREITGFDILTTVPNVLLGWLGGSWAEEVEGMTEEEIGAECTRLLRHFTRQEVPRPVRVVRSSWCSNKYIRGAYSHTTTLCDELGITTHNLTKPVPLKQRNGIYFAGEALHEKYFSTTHGAYLSGAEQAEKILHELRVEPS